MLQGGILDEQQSTLLRRRTDNGLYKSSRSELRRGRGGAEDYQQHMGWTAKDCSERRSENIVARTVTHFGHVSAGERHLFCRLRLAAHSTGLTVPQDRVRRI